MAGRSQAFDPETLHTVLILCAYVVVSVPHGVGVDHSTAAGEAGGQVSTLWGQRLSYPHRTRHPRLECPHSAREAASASNHRNLSPLCSSPHPPQPHSCFQFVFIPWWGLRPPHISAEAAYLHAVKEPRRQNTTETWNRGTPWPATGSPISHDDVPFGDSRVAH